MILLLFIRTSKSTHWAMTRMRSCLMTSRHLSGAAIQSCQRKNASPSAVGPSGRIRRLPITDFILQENARIAARRAKKAFPANDYDSTGGGDESIVHLHSDQAKPGALRSVALNNDDLHPMKAVWRRWRCTESVPHATLTSRV